MSPSEAGAATSGLPPVEFGLDAAPSTEAAAVGCGELLLSAVDAEDVEGELLVSLGAAEVVESEVLASVVDPPDAEDELEEGTVVLTSLEKGLSIPKML